jgi:Terpene cyclase DEP1
VNRLTSTDKTLCAVYAVLGLAALIGTQVVLVRYMSSGDGSLIDDVTANGAATFTAIDLLAVALVGLVFMIVEGRRLGMRFLWVYVLLTILVAISVALPVFLIVRQVKVAGRRDVPAT